jgi:FG-GAP-like repeat
VLLNNGNGTFASAISYGVGSGPESVAVGDFNGDGKPDLAVVNTRTNFLGVLGNSVSVLLGNANGTFANAVSYGGVGTGTGIGVASVAVGDFNGDGKPDLAVAAFNNNGVFVLLGNGDGTFATNAGYFAGSGPSSVTVGDFNGDGKPDLAVADQSSNSVSVLVNNGSGTSVLFDDPVNFF